MVLVHHNAVVVLATSVTATTRVLPVLADAAMAGRHVPTLLPVLAEAYMTGNTAAMLSLGASQLLLQLKLGLDGVQ